MTDHAKTLSPHLSAAYRSEIFGQGSHDDAIHKLASELRSDPELRKHTEYEATRLHSVRRQCFASGISADFLKAALKMAVMPKEEPKNAATEKQ
jgi:hypothetical protein